MATEQDSELERELTEESEISKMEEPAGQINYYQQARDLAMGIHPYSKYASLLLLLGDALLTSLIITYIPCMKIPNPTATTSNTI